MQRFAALNAQIERLGRPTVVALAALFVVLIGGVDYSTGTEISISLFYLAPVALATWYAGRAPGMSIAALSCATWFAAEILAGSDYSHPVIAVWNALVRFGFFGINSVLLAALRNAFINQRQLAQSDSLTGLLGRRGFDDRLQHDFALARRRRGPLTLAYVDLDGFKAVNDARGHAEGDAVLRRIGQVMQASIRQSDTAARLGGDEFALILPDTTAAGAREVVGKVHTELHAAMVAAHWPITCSIGVVTVVDPELDPGRAIAAADALMYDVKRSGKGTVAFSEVSKVAALEPRLAVTAGDAARPDSTNL